MLSGFRVIGNDRNRSEGKAVTDVKYVEGTWMLVKLQSDVDVDVPGLSWSWDGQVPLSDDERAAAGKAWTEFWLWQTRIRERAGLMA